MCRIVMHTDQMCATWWVTDLSHKHMNNKQMFNYTKQRATLRLFERTSKQCRHSRHLCITVAMLCGCATATLIAINKSQQQLLLMNRFNWVRLVQKTSMTRNTKKQKTRRRVLYRQTQSYRNQRHQYTNTTSQTNRV